MERPDTEIDQKASMFRSCDRNLTKKGLLQVCASKEVDEFTEKDESVSVISPAGDEDGFVSEFQG